MFKTIGKTTLLASAALAMAMMAQAAQAQDRMLRGAPAGPPPHPANQFLYQSIAEFLPEESEGRLGMTILGPEVVSLGQMKDALQSQIAEVGNLLPLYFPAELPFMALAGELSLMPSDPHAAGAAMTEFMVNCAPCQQEMTDFGFVYLGSGSSDVYEIMTTKPVRTAADMAGLRVRVGGAPWARLAEHFGAVPVQISVNDMFESMSQGIIEGTMASAADMTSFRLVELVKYVTEVPIGLYQATSNFTTVKTTWDSLSLEDRQAFARAANRSNAEFTQGWGHILPGAADEAALAAGIEYVEPDPAFVAEIESFIATEVQTATDLAVNTFGITDAADHIATYLALLEKWEGISAELGHDTAAISVRVYDEVWSKVDFATYGQ